MEYLNIKNDRSPINLGEPTSDQPHISPQTSMRQELIGLGFRFPTPEKKKSSKKKKLNKRKKKKHSEEGNCSSLEYNSDLEESDSENLSSRDKSLDSPTSKENMSSKPSPGSTKASDSNSSTMSPSNKTVGGDHSDSENSEVGSPLHKIRSYSEEKDDYPPGDAGSEPSSVSESNSSETSSNKQAKKTKIAEVRHLWEQNTQLQQKLSRLEDTLVNRRGSTALPEEAEERQRRIISRSRQTSVNNTGGASISL